MRLLTRASQCAEGLHFRAFHFLFFCFLSLSLPHSIWQTLISWKPVKKSSIVVSVSTMPGRRGMLATAMGNPPPSDQLLTKFCKKVYMCRYTMWLCTHALPRSPCISGRRSSTRPLSVFCLACSVDYVLFLALRRTQFS